MTRTGNNPEISLVFVNFRSVGVLSDALESLADDIGSGFAECIVVNNDRKESSEVERLAERFPLRIVAMPENPGFGVASNEGVRAARARIIGFLNPDVEHVAGSLGDIVRDFAIHPDIGVIGGELVGTDGRPERFSSGKATTLFRLLGNNVGISRGILPGKDALTPVEWTSGASMFVRRTTFSEIGGFDTGFFLYFEDMDFCLRAARAGFRTVVSRHVRFRHRGGSSQRSEKIQKRHFYESQTRYFRKNRPSWETSILSSLRSLFIR